MAAGAASQILVLNLSFILHPCVCVATIVVSDIKDRLSPKNAPPTTSAIIKGRELPVCSAIPTATGVRATTVPTEVPIDSEMKHAAKNNPGNNMPAGRNRKVRFTVASMAPILLAVVAKAPANTKIQIMSIIFSSPLSPMTIKRVEDKFSVAVYNPVPSYAGRHFIQPCHESDRTPYMMTVVDGDGSNFFETCYHRNFLLEDDLENGYAYASVFTGADYLLVAYYHSDGYKKGVLKSLKIKKVAFSELEKA